MDKIETSVKALLGFGDGHGFDHVDRVRKLALTFAEQECADKNIVELAALLHDVDDYKLFGEESAKNLANANKILNDNNINSKVRQQVLEIVSTMGYNKSLEGIRPTTLEGMIVSDADMCDAVGAIGILRTHTYNASKGNVFFDKFAQPQNAKASADEYRAAKSSHSVQHFFDKLLVIPSMLMTESGKEEGAKRQKIMTDFLRELFREEDAKVWLDYLDDFIYLS